MSHCASLLSRTEVRQLEAERLDGFRAARQVGRDAQSDQNVFQTALPKQRNVLYRIKGGIKTLSRSITSMVEKRNPRWTLMPVL
jgi:hypothetical protein